VDANNPSTFLTLLRDLGTPENQADAWRVFLQRYSPLLESWCRRLGLRHSDVDEVTARVLAKLAQVMPTFQYDPSRRFRGYLRTVVYHAVYDFQKESERPGARGSGDSDVRASLEELAAPASLDSVAGELDAVLVRDLDHARQAAERVRAGVDDKTWQAFWLTAVEGLPAADVAARLGIKVANVYVYKNRVAKKLREEGARAQGQPPTGEGS
jgi:RNA polymerase sigma-70 factor (ECF subfamily)